ncbi:hypothetical protein DM860_012758 [Cuscuta australis]|uniref:Auxin-responsive protein n=1 Tax=Cuscuta australis TaxID=267555 RepID=A0A328DUB5_9ASTE|nr:hypothetical protein DM860_012758 [Cuscuta australis]
MGINLERVKNVAKNIVVRSKVGGGGGGDVRRGHLAVYVGEERRRFVVPISYLSHPMFQELLSRAEEEFGFQHPAGGLTLPCPVDAFLAITSYLQSLLQGSSIAS